METFHALLRRQWRRFFGQHQLPPESWIPFLKAVSETYQEFDAGRLLVERALALSSAELHAANSELRGVLQALPDLLFRVEANDRICGVMQSGSDLQHPGLQEIHKIISELTHSPPLPFWQAVERVRDTHASIAIEYSPGSGNWGPFFEIRLLPFVERDIIGIVRDITENKRAETALRESEARSVLAQRAGRVGVFDWNLASHQVFWSGESEEIFGLVRGGFSGTYESWCERVVPEDRKSLDVFINEWLKSGREDSHWEYRVLTSDGQERWVESKGHIFRDKSGQPVRMVGTHLDVTDRKQAERDRLVLGKLESTGILAGGIAHDFNNLLASVLMSLEMAKAHESSVQDVAVSLEEATQAVHAAKLLTQQFIMFARGGSSIRQPTDLARLLRESVPLALSGSNILSEIFLAPDLWTAEVDAGQIGQVIRNLVLNAREAMANGGVVKLRAQNVILGPGSGQAVPPGEYVHIEVADQGSGIPPEVMPKIFDPYFSTKVRGEQKGMGLGLTICHSVVLKHRGAITVESRTTMGTVFHVYLPAMHRLSTAAQPIGRQRGKAQGRILVMDDEQTVRAVLGRILKQAGYDVEIVADGEAAVDLYHRAKQNGQRFDVVMLDLTVRGAMGGQDTIRALLALDPKVQAVVMSGHNEAEVMLEYGQHGFKAALSKPFSRGTLLEVLGQVLGLNP
jgi:PAS domain S-box-containing protein